MAWLRSERLGGGQSGLAEKWKVRWWPGWLRRGRTGYGIRKSLYPPILTKPGVKQQFFCHGVLEDEGLLLGPLKQTNDLDLQLHFFC